MSGPNRTVAWAAVGVSVALAVSLLLPAATAGRAPLDDSVAGHGSARVAGVAPPGPASTGSPHPGSIIYQDVAPGGATSEDPSVAYDSVSAEPIWNVYQTLVAYNGSSTASFLPEISTCVPGDSGADSCQATYGNSLIVDNTSLDEPQYWTFPIDPAAHFYDPSTGTNWSVYPSDVMFTLSRSCSFADLPGFGAQPGWIQCQALLNSGRVTWDSGIHAPLNNTPSNILGSMLINDSTYCPANVMATSNGCITFDAWGGGVAWPFFLELVANPMGAAVEPCGWFTYQGATVPNFAGTLSSAKGDGPCYLPGSSAGNEMTTTNSTAWKTFLSSVSPTAWDSFQELSMNAPAINPNVRWHMVGSGPYYLANQPFQQAVGYTLEQNPAYQAPTGCKGQPNCEPLPGPSNYVAEVTVIYEPTDTPGLQGYANGTTDFATILPGETPRMLNLSHEARIGISIAPSLSIFLLGFTLTFSVAEARTIDPENITVPGDFLSYVGLREFLVNAFPYNTVENTIFTTDGIQYGFNYGGAIPQYMGNYYPTNISWPSGDPVTNPSVNGSAAWWWAQATNPTSPYYDPELVNCTVSSPCQFPFLGVAGVTTLDSLIHIYLSNITSLSGGRITPTTFACGFGNCCAPISCWPVQPTQLANVPAYSLSWAADYPDPTEFVALLYSPNGIYGSLDALSSTLAPLTCSQGPTSASAGGLAYWARQPGVPQDCQGNAYNAMVWGINEAAGMAVSPNRVLMYNMVEHVANNLALYVYYDQENSVTTYASWIAGSSVSTNPIIGGAGDFLWYNVRYGPAVSNVTFTETGLNSGVSWAVVLNGTPLGSVTNTITFTEPNGVYPFSVQPVAGYAANRTSGTVVVLGGPANETILFTSTSSSASAVAPDAVAAYLVIAAGIVVAVVVLRRWRRQPPTP